MHAVIMAGGKGTRLKAITGNEIPKPMAKVNGKPILEHQIEQLKENGIKKLTLVVGYLKDKIINYFGDGRAFDVEISYISEDTPLGTGGALFYLKNIPERDILLVFGDTIFDIDIDRMFKFHKSKSAGVTLFVHPNSHPYDSDLIVANKNGLVTGFDSKNNMRDYYYHNVVNAGFYMLKKEVLSFLNKPQKVDFDKEIVMPLINQEYVYAYRSTEYIKDAGTVERIASVEEDIKSGIVKARNLKNKQKCIFLDRDGTLNVYKGFIKNPVDIELIAGASEAVKKINKSGYLAIVVTNQPTVARGECTINNIDNMNAAMEVLLGKEGAYIDDLMFCPHHPDKGFEGERVEFKVDCNCRKPKTGMIVHFVDNYNINIVDSYMIGDDDRDILAGKNAGAKTIKIGNGGKIESDFFVNNILEAVSLILEQDNK